MHETIYAGIDVSKGWCDAALEVGDGSVRFDQTPEGRDDLIGWLKRQGVTHAVLEASGGYERPVLRALDKAGLQACLVPPQRVRALARASGRSAKTDALDAHLLAAFGRLLGPRVRQSQGEDIQALATLVRRRRQIVDLVTLEDNRRQQEDDPAILADIAALLGLLRTQLETIDRRIANQIAACAALRDKHRVLMAFAGVGPVTCAVLLAEMPELGSLDAKQAASLAGLAPFNNDSGMSEKKRSIRGGRAGVRCALFMAALSAIRHNPEIRTFYRRLRELGKPQRVAHIAAARKIIVILNAMLRDASTAQHACR
jgi:transposase